MSKRDGHHQMIFLMPKKIHRKLKVRVAREATSMTDVLNNLAERYVEKKLNLK